MIIFFYGPDTYRLKKAISETKESYLKKYSTGVNIFNFDFSDRTTKVDSMEDAVKSISFFNEVKLIIIKNAFLSKETLNSVKNIIDQYNLGKLKEVVLLISENLEEASLAKKDKKFFEKLKKDSQPVVIFNYLTGAKLESWVKNEFYIRQSIIEGAALKLLIEMVGNETWALVNEINKLANYKNKIGKGEVLKLVYSKEEDKTFKLTDAFVSRDINKIFPILYEEIERGKDPHSILALLAYQIRNLIMVKDLLERKTSADQISKLVGIHPFVARKLTSAARLFSLDNLKEMQGELSEIDVATKEGRVDLEDALYNFVFS